MLRPVSRMILTLGVLSWASATFALEAKTALEKIGIRKGICVVLGLPEAGQSGFVTDLAQGSELTVYFQSPSGEEVAAVRQAARAAGLLGRRVFVDQGDFKSLHLADNLAGALLIPFSVAADVAQGEILRVLHPEGKAIIGEKEIVKPFPNDTDVWSHPHHGADNNPQSTDRRACWPGLTQFLAEPKFCPMPEVSVAAAGRVYRAFGHIAHKANQNAMLNTLLCVNGYNGTILWERKLEEGFMIHRNTMIATPEVLYLGDDESCQLIDTRSGKIKDRIVISDQLADGPVWKWMALEDGVLVALLGGKEVKISTQASPVPGMGHWPWGMWEGHDYKDPKTNFGFGRTLAAIDPKTKETLWTHREEEYIDSRGVCMKNGRIYFYSPEKFLGCLDAQTGKILWKTSATELLEAIGPNGPAQLWVTGYSTTTYIKCNEKYVFFAGPQRARLVVVSAADGKLVWQKDHGNYQLVLRDDGFYAAGPQASGGKLDYETGKVLVRLPDRRACTRATGSIDSVFYRTNGGTVRIPTDSNVPQHIAPMRPACQDGVIISDGHLYWGPWMCGCQLSLYGHICLAPAGDFDFHPAIDNSRIEPGQGDLNVVQKLEIRKGDWPVYGGDNARTSASEVVLPRAVEQQWRYELPSAAFPTAPVTAGGLVFVADRNGVVRALDAATGKQRWQAYTAAAIYFPPAIAEDRLFVGSADGRVYAFEAASGRRLWSFRLAPAEQWIPVYGKLISRWPVAGGVVVRDGTVYAAAGIAHYDGTYVVALDAVSGTVKWYNDSSGTLSQTAQSGISLQGNLYIDGNQLCFVGGGVCETARYDLETGKCVNRPYEGVTSRFHTAFYAYYPIYGKHVSLDHTFADGSNLVYDASYDGAWHSTLGRLAPLPPGTTKPVKPVSRYGLWARPGQDKSKPKALWQKPNLKFSSFVVGNQILLATGEDPAPFLAAVNHKDGSGVWRQKLPAVAVKGGTAVNHKGQIIVSLENGQVLCFAAGE